MIELDEENEDRVTSVVIRSKEENISELEANLDREQYVIDFLEQENQHLKTKQIIDDVKTIKTKKEGGRAKGLLEETLDRFGEIEDAEDHPLRHRPKRIVLKRALAHERQREVEFTEKLTPSELLAL